MNTKIKRVFVAIGVWGNACAYMITPDFNELILIIVVIISVFATGLLTTWE